MVVSIAAVVFFSAAVFKVAFLPMIQSTQHVSSSQLSKIVSVSKLSTARFTYEGIAEKKNKDGNVEYHVFYSADVEAGADMSKINFGNIDEEKKIVYPVLPEITLATTVDDTSLEFFERNFDINIEDVIELCRKDASKEVKADSDIYDLAVENLKDTIEALTNPLLAQEGYTISWEKPEEDESAEEGSSKSSEQSASEQSSADKESGEKDPSKQDASKKGANNA